MSSKRLAGKKILVVGAAGNLGPRWVKALAEESALVLAAGLGLESDDSLSGVVGEYPDNVKQAELDITQSFDPEELFARLGVGGPIDGIVFNSGIDAIPGTGHTKLEDYDRDEWARIFGVNLFGIVSALNAFIPRLANPSSVVVLGSLYGIVSPKPALYSHFNGGSGSIKHPAYGASKAALVAAARQYGTHLAPQGIRVNTLTLGGVAAGQDETFVKSFRQHVPQNRMLTADDIVPAMLFLLSHDSQGMTAQNLIVDGGYTAW